MIKSKTTRSEQILKLDNLKFNSYVVILRFYKQNTCCLPFVTVIIPYSFLNQARAWFLSIASVRELQYVCVCVCVSAPRLLITSGVRMWCDIDHMRLVE